MTYSDRLDVRITGARRTDGPTSPDSTANSTNGNGGHA
jgi:hypothetical protein